MKTQGLLLVLAFTACDDTDHDVTHTVGTAAYHLVDGQRDEPETADPLDHRELMVRAYYPAELGSGRGEAGYFLDEAEGRLNAQLNGMPEDAFTAMADHAERDARLADGRFPVLVFSPGRDTPAALYTYLLEDLASRGYVVLAISHPYKSGAVMLPGGMAYPTASAGDTVEEQRNLIILEWSEDQRFVIDWLAGLRDDRLVDHLDLDHIGVLGHSLGGAAAFETCAHEPRVRACADLDGSVSELTVPAAMDRPLLILRAEGPGNLEDTLARFYAALPASGDMYKISVVGGGHYTFSDLPAIVERLLAIDPSLDPSALLLGSVSAARGAELVGDHSAAFFDRYLRARSPSILEASSAPEILVEHK